MESYADLEIRIFTREDAGYPVEITLNYDQQFARGFLSTDILVGEGENPFHWLFADDNSRSAWAYARGAHPRRRIRLRIDAGAPELHALPWEQLCDAETGLDIAATDATPFSRYLSGTWQPGAPIPTLPIKILVAIANPGDLPEKGLVALDADAEWDALRQATEGLDVELVRLSQPCTLSAIENELRKGYHILHLIAHGAFDRRRGQAVLYLADQDNWVDLVPEHDIAGMLARHLADGDAQHADRLRLVFLAACEGAVRDTGDAFRGLAPAVVKAGVPAVVAMQEQISISAMGTFANVFYRQVLDHGLVDLAGNQARATLLTSGSSEAATPVVFMRMRSGKLFERQGQILGEEAESFWQTLLENIEDGFCTPFLGSGVTAGLLPTTQELAQTLARQYHYPFDDDESLPHVGQFVGTLDNRRLRRDVMRYLIEGFHTRMELPLDAGAVRRKSLSQVVEESGWRDRLRESGDSEIFWQLADLGLPIYITTNYDNLMTLALEALPRQSRPRDPRRLIVTWREREKAQVERPHWTLDPPASPEKPVVLHLFGTDDEPLSMVLTEDDHLDFLTRIARDYEYLLPSSVNAALASTTLLFLGYRLGDLDLKIIMRGLLTNLDLEKWGMLHVAVQLEASPDDVAQQQEVIRYFQKYFANARIDVYWGSTQQFVADLHARWKGMGA